MSDGMTREDLREALRDMQLTINRGFDGVNDRMDGMNDRMDVANGRTSKHESLLAVHEERWQRLDRATSVKPGPASAPEDMGLNKEWKTLATVGTLAAGAVSGLVWGLWKVAQFISAVAKP